MGFRDWLSNRAQMATVTASLKKTEVRTDPSTLISQELMQEIDKCVTGHHPSERVLYTDDMQSVQVVGESFREETFQALRTKYQSDGADEEIDVWFSGVLLPEQNNKYDVHATMVVLLDPNSENDNFTALHVGYIPKDVATKLQPKLVKFLAQGKVIPLLLRVNGGTSGKPNFGIVAKAKTSAIKF